MPLSAPREQPGTEPKEDASSSRGDVDMTRTVFRESAHTTSRALRTVAEGGGARGRFRSAPAVGAWGAAACGRLSVEPFGSPRCNALPGGLSAGCGCVPASSSSLPNDEWLARSEVCPGEKEPCDDSDGERAGCPCNSSVFSELGKPGTRVPTWSSTMSRRVVA